VEYNWKPLPPLLVKVYSGKEKHSWKPAPFPQLAIADTGSKAMLPFRIKRCGYFLFMVFSHYNLNEK
jgi:hypothetical protein